jgi:predicted transcriptional regulator
MRSVEAKQAVLDLLDKLPDDCTLDDVLYHVYVLRRLSQGLAEADAGELIPHEKVEQELRQRWLLGDA